MANDVRGEKVNDHVEHSIRIEVEVSDETDNLLPCEVGSLLDGLQRFDRPCVVWRVWWTDERSDLYDQF